MTTRSQGIVVGNQLQIRSWGESAILHLFLLATIFVGLHFSSASLSAQESFYEFSRRDVPTPDELRQHIARLRARQSRSSLTQERFESIRKILDSMSDEQKNQLAETFRNDPNRLKELGKALDPALAEKFKGLADEMGFAGKDSSQIRSELEQKFSGMNFEDFIKGDFQKAQSGTESDDQGNQGGREEIQGSDERLQSGGRQNGDFGGGQNGNQSLRRSESGVGSAGDTRSESQNEDNSRNGDSDNGSGQPKLDPDVDEIGDPVEGGNQGDRRSENRGLAEGEAGAKSDNPFEEIEAGAAGEQISREEFIKQWEDRIAEQGGFSDDDLKKLREGLEERSSGAKSGKGESGDGSSKSANELQAGGEGIEKFENLIKEFSRDMRDQGGSNLGDQGISNQGNQSDTESARSAFSKSVERLRESLKSRGRNFQENASNGTGEPDKGALDKIWDTISGKGNKRSGERLSQRFDRMIFDAAKKSLEKGGESGNSSLRSTFEKMVDRFSEKAKEGAFEKQQQAIADRLNRRLSQNRQSGNSESGSSSSDWDFGSGNSNRSAGSSGARNSSFGSSSSSNSGGRLDFGSGWDASLPSLPTSIDMESAIYFLIGVMVVIALVLFVVALLGGPKEADKQPRKPKLKPVKSIRSPKDLVQAFDYFLLKNFGYKSSWWNAEHAEKVLEQHAPEMGEEISGLVNDYVKARYTENDSSENQPKDHLATLKSLAQVGAEGRSKNQKSNKNRLLVAPSEG